VIGTTAITYHRKEARHPSARASQRGARSGSNQGPDYSPRSVCSMFSARRTSI